MKPALFALILIDGAHFNFHTVDGRYQAFAKLARRDGYLVCGNDKAFSAKSLRDAEDGMNDAGAPQNPQFMRNVLHWLSGIL